MGAVNVSRVVLGLLGWVEDLVADPDREYSTEEDRMRLVIELSWLNVAHGTGGTFGAGAFDLGTNRLVAPGANLVAATDLSTAHAEIVALIIVQQIGDHFDLGNWGRPLYELVASKEPCAQCFGSVPWSGVRRLMCRARDEDVRDKGFDEGPKMPGWVSSWERRGITMACDVCCDEAAAVSRSPPRVEADQQRSPGE